MITDFPRSQSAFRRNFINRNIRTISDRPRQKVEEALTLGIEGFSLALKIKQPQHPTKDINENYPKDYLKLKRTQIRLHEVFDCVNSSTETSELSPEKIYGVRRTSIKPRDDHEVIRLKAQPRKVSVHEIVLKNRRTSRESFQKVSLYPCRAVLPLSVTKIPDDSYYRERFSTKSNAKGKFPTQQETINGFNTFKPKGREFERLRRGGMADNKDKSLREVSSPPPDTRQSLSVADNGSTFSHKENCEYFNDHNRPCSNFECRTFVGEASRNRKFPKEYEAEPVPQKDEICDEYLHDSYNYVFQRHVDNLNTVISQHVKSGPDKTKTHVHIHPTENFCKEDNSTRHDRKNSPKSKKKALTKLEVKNPNSEKPEPKIVTFDDRIEANGEGRSAMNVVTEKMQDVGIFEELNNNDHKDPKPVITFNHVSSESKCEQLSFEVVQNSGSRSPSPLLEVPSFKEEVEKETLRPPL